ncbi:hypothetical protein [Ekhidna sp.]|uniref:hypothetical protein n=1 Tax=Ekhidna sp. TaxID=2608089 RepID=UPI00329A7E41
MKEIIPSAQTLIGFIDLFKAVLDIRNKDPKRSFIDEELFRITDFLIPTGQIGGINGAHSALFKFRFLFQDINILQNAKSPQINKWIKKLKKCPLQEYYGIRLEIHIAAFLTSKNIAFKCPDPPDFEIEWKSKTLKFECTTRHLTASKNKEDVLKSFRTPIEKKSEKKKNYQFVDGNSALLIECTNLSSHNAGLFWSEYEQTRKFLKQEIELTKYGAVFTYSFIWNTSNGRYESIYSRIDSENINQDLTDFLDTFYPTGKHTVPPGHAYGSTVG